MTVASEFFPEKGLIISTFSGKVDSADLYCNFEVMPQDPRFHPDMDHLVDFSGVARVEVPTETIRKVAEEYRVFSDQCRRIIVAPQDLAYGLCRMYEGYRDLPESRFFLFRTLPEAMAWLTQNPSPIWPPADQDDKRVPAG
ncbi:MAG: hypothetical protein ACLFPR_11680 [Desulfococcaceae bacterium]